MTNAYSEPIIRSFGGCFGGSGASGAYLMLKQHLDAYNKALKFAEYEIHTGRLTSEQVQFIKDSIKNIEKQMNELKSVIGDITTYISSNLAANIWDELGYKLFMDTSNLRIGDYSYDLFLVNGN